MANARARAVYKQNTAVLYYEPSETGEVPVSTARIVPVGAANAARSGATLQLVGGMVEADGRQEIADGRRVVEAPQVVEVEPPRAAPRKRPAQKRPTRVIAYNVHIVAEGEERIAYDAAPFEDEAPTARMEMPPQHAMPQPTHRHREMQFEVPRDARFDMPREQRMPRSEMPPHGQFRGPQQHAPFAPPRAHELPGGMPRSFFGALENMGGMLHEQTRRVAASGVAGSYKQLLAQQLDIGRGGLFSNRNLCIAVGAYALILFLLAFFTG